MLNKINMLRIRHAHCIELSNEMNMKTAKYKLTELLKGVEMKKILFVIGLIVLLLAPVLSEALPVPVVNSSFETNVLADGQWQTSVAGWTTTGAAGVTGVYNPTDNRYNVSIPDGANVGFSNRGGTLFQALSYNLLADTQLVLSVDIGWRLDGTWGAPNYAIELWAGNNFLAQETSTQLIQGGFATAVLTYDVLSDNSYLGQQVRIVLANRGGSQANFDNVRLENHSSVPEPSTLLLLGAGLFGFGIFSRKRRK